MEVNNKHLRNKVKDGLFEYYPTACSTCNEFSMDFPIFFTGHPRRLLKRSQEQFEEMKERFVRHVNLVHLGYNRSFKQKEQII